MRYSLLVCAAPEHPAAQTALLTARAILDRGHTLQRLFFYRDGVLLSQPDRHPELHRQWRELIQQYDLDAVVCVTAAERRGLPSQSPLPWVTGGLGQWADAIHDSDRTVSFG